MTDHLNDTEDYGGVITSVEHYTGGDYGYDIGWRSFGEEHGWSMGIPLTEGFEPKVGDLIRLWGKGFGFPFRGVAINGNVVFYRTAAEDQAKHEQDRADRERVAREKYDADQAGFNVRINTLPEVFRQRIAGFRERNPDFGWQYESYELMVCEDAVKIADALKTVEAINAWAELPYDQQKTAVPISDGHSGNSFGAACNFAAIYLSEPDLIPNVHGALCPLVGCREYGCYSTTLTAEDLAHAHG